MAVAVSTSLGCSSPLPRALDLVASTGARLVDVLVIDGWRHINTSDLAHDFAATVASLESQLSQRGLTAIAFNSGVGPELHHRDPASNEKRQIETEALCRAMVHFGIRIAAIQPRAADRNRPYPDVLTDCVASLRQQYAIAERFGVQLALELHVHSPFESVEQAEQLFEAMPEVRLVYDPTHFIQQGLPLTDTTWIMDRAIHVHARDAAEGKLQTALGTGKVDFGWLARSLRDRRYTGHVSIEFLETDAFDAVDSARRLHDALASGLA
jgi:sugar phosphate isomerase/epimerase